MLFRIKHDFVLTRSNVVDAQPDLLSLLSIKNHRSRLANNSNVIVRMFSCPSVLIFALGTQKMRQFHFDYPQHMPW